MSAARIFAINHLLPDDQREQIFAMTDALAERVAKSAAPRSDPPARSPDFSASRRGLGTKTT
jgi:hypothetical protein